MDSLGDTWLVTCFLSDVPAGALAGICLAEFDRGQPRLTEIEFTQDVALGVFTVVAVLPLPYGVLTGLIAIRGAVRRGCGREPHS